MNIAETTTKLASLADSISSPHETIRVGALVLTRRAPTDSTSDVWYDSIAGSFCLDEDGWFYAGPRAGARGATPRDCMATVARELIAGLALAATSRCPGCGDPLEGDAKACGGDHCANGDRS